MTSKSAPWRIMIVDDHELVRDGLALRIGLYPDLMVCGQAAGEEEALSRIKELSPDLVLVDISLKEGHGLDLVKRIRSLDGTIKLLVISGFDESLYAERALRAGALGYLCKQESNDKLIEAIRTVLSGHRYVSTALAQRLVDQAYGTAGLDKSPLETLTTREMEIFRLIGSGLTTGAIAARLNISPHTIDTHRENIKKKLGAKNAGELSLAAVQWVMGNG